jgi:ubiquinone/menaquinone biosynthesis C-methylase UbiE
MAVEAYKTAVHDFWNVNPCGAKFVSEEPGSKPFFDSLTEHRYSAESHIPAMVNFPRWKDCRVLEVGCGLGTDAEQFARHGAIYTGIDLTETSVEMCRRRFAVQGLPGTFEVADAEQLPFPDDSFDMAYSHGVIHHTPDTEKAVREILRVLRPGGSAIVMLYHRNSWNYWGNISLLRRFGAVLLFLSPRLVQAITKLPLDDLEQRRKVLAGRPSLLFDQNWFLSQNTDGYGNPISKVYSRRSAARLFEQFGRVGTNVRFLHTKWLLGAQLLPKAVQAKLGSHWGWHLWVTAVKANPAVLVSTEDSCQPTYATRTPA